ncbi:NB-ARC domain, LRR domain containing protein [Parasponia andersonii]|uniref:NB-ARC domain, LRR domain containing protein n=1 Tax=Parasponia andersonii TaxID=3476 RepID=A0A2P5D2X8_PARAD|nr:NB-ARC domain, LRR domain containing protein [Parasponia andersonii]
MALELVGGALLSALFQSLFERVTSREVLYFFRAKKLDEKMLKKLRIKLWSASAVVSSAEEMQIRNPTVREWLDDLKEATNEIENLIDEIKTETLVCRLKGEPGSSTNQVLSLISTSLATEVEPKMEEILDRLEFILNQKDALGLKEGAQNRPLSRSLPSPLVEESDIFGRRFDKEAILRLLLSDDGGGIGGSTSKISVIPIVGMAGIGKTTLAQLVYNDERVNGHFDTKAWVTVSDDFDVLKITKTLFEKVHVRNTFIDYSFDSEELYDTKDLHQLQVKLKKALENRRFLFVLDDVWNENYDNWDCLRSSFESGACGSKIVATTRSEIAASRMSDVPSFHLQTISSEDCWLLFVKHAFKNLDYSRVPPNLEQIGKKIVEKCNDLPLAVKSLGGLLRSERNPRKWEDILKSDIWEFSERDSNILPALWLSYRCLLPHLKRCFAYCSLFPKNYKIAKENLVLLWMAEDLLPPQTGKRIEDVGEECFDHLISRSLIQKSSQDGSLFIMHDLVNDLAKFVLGKFGSRLEHDDLSSTTGNSIHHLSYEKRNIDGVLEFLTLAEVKHLRTFLPIGCPEVGEELIWNKLVLDVLLPSARYLRVLSLSQYPITELPCSIGNLKHLRYLSLSSTRLKVIPDQICTLYNLQTLLLLSCKYLTQLPAYMGSLINLRHLDIRGTNIKEMPAGMCNMKDLQTLTDFVLGKGNASNIKNLRELKHLRGGLRITGIENIISVGDVLEANMKGKEYLSELNLSFGVADDSQKEKEVLDGLQPHRNLVNLCIHGYKGTSFPDWTGHHSFSNMVTISLIGCINCCFLPPLGQLPSLKKLFIIRFHMVRSIGAEFYSKGSFLSQPFRSLEKLVFRHMLEWQDWSFPQGNRNEEVENFPSLRELHLEYCPKLTGGLPDKMIETLIIKNCEKLAFGPSPGRQRFA